MDHIDRTQRPQPSGDVGGGAPPSGIAIQHENHAREPIERLDKSIDEAVEKAPAEMGAVVEGLQALRGVAKTTAVTIVAELGSLSRFPNPRQLMGYSGLVSSEFTTGNRIRRGQITKTGNAHLRHVIGEAAWLTNIALG